MITSNDYNVLLIFHKNKCFNEKDAITIKQVSEEVNISLSTIRKALISLLELNYINKGFQHWKASSYFITEKGIEYINKI